MKLIVEDDGQTPCIFHSNT